MDALQSQQERRRRIQLKREARQRQIELGESEEPIITFSAHAQPQSADRQPSAHAPSAPPTGSSPPKTKKPRWERQQAQFLANLEGKPADLQQQLKNHMAKLMDYRRQLRQKRDENRRLKESLLETPERDYSQSALDHIRDKIIQVEVTAASFFSETLAGILPADPQSQVIGLAQEMSNLARKETEYRNKLFELEDTRRRIDMARRAQFSSGPQHSQYFPSQTGPDHFGHNDENSSSGPGSSSAGYGYQNPYTPTFERIPVGGGQYPAGGINIPTPEPAAAGDFATSGQLDENDIEAIFEHAHSKIKPVDIPKEMNVSILEHQRQGLAWLLHQEESHNRGGILADDMGLGKTVQTICLIFANPPAPEIHERNSATLIVCPLALLDTWSSDLRDRVHPEYRPDVYIHHNKHNPRTSNMARVCRNHQVVITTFEAVANEFKDREKNGKSHPLFDVSWYRIVLDEAHLIKNHAAQRSKAVAELRATYRLCLSGTPMQNNLDELWPMLRFLRIRPYCTDRQKFKHMLPAKPKHDAEIDENDLNEKLDKLRLFLAGILLRRTKDTMINGVKILANLPAKVSFEINITMGSAEMSDYTAFEEEIKARARDLMEEHNSDIISNILVLLLRLRQRTCHPELPKITSKPWKMVPMQASHDMIQQAKNMTPGAKATALAKSGIQGVDLHEVAEDGQSVKSENVKDETKDAFTRLRDESSSLSVKRQCSQCDDLYTLNNIFIMDPCGHSICPPCFDYLPNDNSNAQETEDGVFCPRCNQRVAAKAVPYALIRIVHRNPGARNEDIQREYMTLQRQERAAVRADESAQQARLRDFLGGIQSNAGLDFMDDDEEAIQPLGSYQDVEDSGSQIDALVPEGATSDLAAPTKRGYFFTRGLFADQGGLADDFGNIHLAITDPTKVDAIKNKRYDQEDINKIARLFYRSNCFKNGWTESVKCNAVIETLYDVWSEAPGDKIIIFSVFTSFLDVLTIPLDAAGIKYIMYTGELDIEERNNALRDFKQGNCKVILISLRAGNVGLTLTAANRVFMLEPFWNPYVEDQAKDRVHRIGQTKEVKVYRFIVNNTVEDRIVQLQLKKRIMIESALDKNARDKVMSMSKENILFALGLKQRMS